jgi:hypothetical protein
MTGRDVYFDIDYLVGVAGFADTRNRNGLAWLAWWCIGHDRKEG